MRNQDNNSQTQQSRDKNAEFFLKNLGEYSKSVGQLDTYKRINVALTTELRGIQSLLDVGNGGVFDYDTFVVGHVIGLDLFLDQLPTDMQIPQNVTMETGDALNIPKADNSFDGVVMVMLLHHLVGNSVTQCTANLERAISEAFRVLHPGGKLVIVESCVPLWFYRFEKLVFPLAVPVINRLLTHPPAFQYTVDYISAVIRNLFGTDPTVTRIPKGKYVLQFGFKFPARFTPVQPYLLTACKP
ncbi:MAG TPA: class I SAM-dependent methyltransferase [Burkholderiales bacterium]|nr:class I SAM-dependent methyltransferase [Burkholderiales bacterium]